MKLMQWLVYIVECEDGSLYTGSTNDIAKRMEKHRKGTGSKYVKSRTFKRVVYIENCRDKSSAFKREYEIKQLTREEKMRLISKKIQISNYFVTSLRTE